MTSNDSNLTPRTTPMNEVTFDIYVTNADDAIRITSAALGDEAGVAIELESTPPSTIEEIAQWLGVTPVMCCHVDATRSSTSDEALLERACRVVRECVGDVAVVRHNCTAWALKRAGQLLVSSDPWLGASGAAWAPFQQIAFSRRPTLCPTDPDLLAIQPNTSRVRVVEMIAVMSDRSHNLEARYVLRHDRTIVTIAETARLARLADKRTSHIPGADGTFVTRDSPEEWLHLLPTEFTGSRHYATKVFQMDEYEAVRSMLPTPKENTLPSP